VFSRGLSAPRALRKYYDRALREGIIELDESGVPKRKAGTPSWVQLQENYKAKVPVSLGDGSIKLDLDLDYSNPDDQAVFNRILAYGGDARQIRDEATARTFVDRMKADVKRDSGVLTKFSEAQKSILDAGVTESSLRKAATGSDQPVRRGGGLLTQQQTDAMTGTYAAASPQLGEFVTLAKGDIAKRREQIRDLQSFQFKETLKAQLQALANQDKNEFTKQLKMLELSVQKGRDISRQQGALARTILEISAKEDGLPVPELINMARDIGLAFGEESE
jgi:hypothetical protein